MNRVFLILIIGFILVLTFNVISASDILVWQGQYYTGTTFNTGTYEFNFSVYDGLTGGEICYSNTTTLTTGNFGEWKTEPTGVCCVCNNVSKDYFLEIKINGEIQGDRKRLTMFNFLRKNVNEVTTGTLQTDSQVVAPIINVTTIMTNEINITSDANIFGTLRGHSPLKLSDEINFIKTDGTITSSLYNAPRELSSTLPSAFADSLIHDIINETNDYGMQECFWDENTETMQMCISGAYLAGRATTISRSLQVVGNTTNKPVDENFTKCEGNNYVDCQTDLTGADLLVEDDIEAIGSIFSQENITAGYFIGDGSLLTGISSVSTNLTNYALKNQSETFAGNITATETGFFSYLGSLVNRITKLFVENIDASGNVNATNYTLNGTTIQDWDDVSSGLTQIYLENDLNATNTDYTDIFTIALTPSKINIIKFYLVQSSPTAGVAVQNRVIASGVGPVGNCNFMTQAGAAVENVDNIAVSTTSADTGETAMSLDVNTPFINTVICTMLADSSQKNLVVQFQSETAVANVTTHSGSYYTNAVN